ncbi:MAG TPA: YggT family protein [Xanthobacteraceae bacterium]|nr:YggT family protein [Xanthobacteraceae bacterium]
MIYTLVGLVDLILAVVMYVIFAQVIVSWLIVFNVINLHSGAVRSIVQALERMTGPIYRPIRKLLPDFGGIDFSPLVVILIIIFLRSKLLPGILMEAGPTIT